MEKYGDTLSIILILEGTYIVYKLFLESSNKPLIFASTPNSGPGVSPSLKPTTKITKPDEEPPFPRENDPSTPTEYKAGWKDYGVAVGFAAANVMADRIYNIRDRFGRGVLHGRGNVYGNRV